MKIITKLLKFTKSKCINQGRTGRQKPYSNLNRKSLIHRELFIITEDLHIEQLASKE